MVTQEIEGNCHCLTEEVSGSTCALQSFVIWMEVTDHQRSTFPAARSGDRGDPRLLPNWRPLLDVDERHPAALADLLLVIDRAVELDEIAAFDHGAPRGREIANV
jgi:hypothetical protein